MNQLIPRQPKVKRKRDPGRCFLRAGFRNVGFTKGGLVALQLLPADMPPAIEPRQPQQSLFTPPAREAAAA